MIRALLTLSNVFYTIRVYGGFGGALGGALGGSDGGGGLGGCQGRGGGGGLDGNMGGSDGGDGGLGRVMHLPAMGIHSDHVSGSRKHALRTQPTAMKKIPQIA